MWRVSIPFVCMVETIWDFYHLYDVDVACDDTLMLAHEIVLWSLVFPS